MTLQQVAWTAIALEIPGLGLYIGLGAGLLLFRANWAYLTTTVLASLPVLLTVYGVVRWLKNR